MAAGDFLDGEVQHGDHVVVDAAPDNESLTFNVSRARQPAAEVKSVK